MVVVENADAVRQLIGLMLKDAGHRVQGVATAEQALAILRDQSQVVDLVIADMTPAARGQCDGVPGCA